jgi:hypothetical protein
MKLEIGNPEHIRQVHEARQKAYEKAMFRYEQEIRMVCPDCGQGMSVAELDEEEGVITWTCGGTVCICPECDDEHDRPGCGRKHVTDLTGHPGGHTTAYARVTRTSRAEEPLPMKF